MILLETDTETWLRFLKARDRSTDTDEKCLSTYIDQKIVMEQAAWKFANMRKISFVKFNNEYGSPEKSAALLYENLKPLILEKQSFKSTNLSNLNEHETSNS